MKRIAYCSPINPQPSGISDYSEELLPYLGQYAEVVLFVTRGVEPSNSRLQQHLEVRPLDQLPRMHVAQPFDALVYHMGNSPAHAEIYEHALNLPGVVVLHDYVLHHFRLWHAAAHRDDVDRYRREMAARYGVRGAAVAERMARGQLLDAAFEMPLVEDLVESARGVIGHSRLIVERVRGLHPGVAVARVPMGVPLPPLEERAAARLALGLPLDTPVWASFGHINPYKRMEPVLRAFRYFRRLYPSARYVLVGSVSPSYDLQGLIRRLGLERAVTVTGFVAPEAWSRYVAASDLCLNLRYPTAGETSASVLRLLGAARPVLVSAIDALDELPDDVCAKVDPGPAEVDQILHYALVLHKWPRIARELGRSARDFVAREHSLVGAARGYAQFLGQLYGWGQLQPLRPPLWEVDPPTQPPLPVVEGEYGHHAPGQPTSARHALEAGLGVVDLAHETGAALAELGVTADDDAILRDTAGTIADLLGARPAQGRWWRRR